MKLHRVARPTLEFASAVWDPHKQRETQLLEKVQRRAAGYVNNNYTDRSPGSVTSMLENLNWTSLEHQRRQVHLGILYKINKGLVDIDTASVFHHSDPRTRGAQCLHHGQIQHPALFHSPQPLHWSPSRVD